MTDEYELMPADELDELRKEVDILKSNPFGDSKHGKSLLTAVEQLTVAVNRLNKIFSDAEVEILNENEKVKSVDEHLHELQDENRKIATGIVTVAQMLKESGGVIQPSMVQEQPVLQEEPAIEQPWPHAVNQEPPSQFTQETQQPPQSWQPVQTDMPMPPAPNPNMGQEALPRADAISSNRIYENNQPTQAPVDPWQPQASQPPPLPQAPAPAPTPQPVPPGPAPQPAAPSVAPMPMPPTQPVAPPLTPSQQLVDNPAQPLPMPPPPPPGKENRSMI